jgi:hypothetical protein
LNKKVASSMRISEYEYSLFKIICSVAIPAWDKPTNMSQNESKYYCNTIIFTAKLPKLSNKAFWINF